MPDAVNGEQCIKHKINKETWMHLQMNGIKMINNFGRVMMKSKGYIVRDDQFVFALLEHQDDNYYIVSSIIE